VTQKNVLVLGSLSTDPGEDQALDTMTQFMGAALRTEETGIQVFLCHIDELGFVANNDMAGIFDFHNDRELTGYDLVFFRGKLRAAINDVSLVSYFLQKQDIPSVNSAYSNRRATGKVPQMFQVRDLGLPIPYTVSAASKYLPGLIASHLSYPVVVKDIHGGHGHDNYLVSDEEQLREILDGSPEIRFMAQQFIPNDCDYRVLIVGPKELIIKRQAVGESHLNNTSQGGNATLVDPAGFPAEIVAEARRFAESCSYEIAGVDVVMDKETGAHYYLEINSQPQVATGAFVPEKTEMVGEYFRGILA
jgi:glutathione synthase/RimK-type ligase-like ATP-grasp enzyme